MKTKIVLIIPLLFVLTLSACNSGNNGTEAEIADPDPASSTMDEAYPLEEKQPPGEPAYPITEAGREILMKTWSLVTLTENGTRQTVKPQTLQLNTDGSYTLTSEKETESGAWTAKLSENEPSLTLYPEEGDPSIALIVELSQTLLHLRSWQENTQMDTMYLAAE